jgi:hypothetical protein
MWSCLLKHKGIKPGSAGGSDAYWSLAVKRGKDGKGSRRSKEDEIDAAWATHEAAS